MADKKISELTSITGTDVDDANDTIAIVDSSAGQTKKITREELFKDVEGAAFTGDVTLGSGQNYVGNISKSTLEFLSESTAAIFTSNRTDTDDSKSQFSFKDTNSVTVGKLTGAGSTAVDGKVIITREKGDNRYAELTGAEFAGNVTLSNPNLGSLRVKRGPSGREWGIGTVGDSTAMSVYDADNNAVVARFDEQGTSVVGTTSVITAEKGDARYAQLSGADFTGNVVIKAPNSTTNRSFGFRNSDNSIFSQLYTDFSNNRQVLGVWDQSGANPQYYDFPNATGATGTQNQVLRNSDIERGSNANGEYVRFPDGTQICTFPLFVNQSQAANTSDSLSWTFPAAFSGKATCSASITTSGTTSDRENAAKDLRVSIASDTSSSTAVAWFNSSTSTTRTVRIGVTAIGRWF